MFKNVYDVFTYWKQWRVVQQFPKDTTNSPKYKEEKNCWNKRIFTTSVSITCIPSAFLINACNFFLSKYLSVYFFTLIVTCTFTQRKYKYNLSYFYTIVNSLSNIDMRLLIHSESSCTSLSYILHPFASSTQNALATFYPNCSNLSSHP